MKCQQRSRSSQPNIWWGKALKRSRGQQSKPLMASTSHQVVCGEPRGRRVVRPITRWGWESNQGEHKDTLGADGSRCACVHAFKKRSNVHGRHHRRLEHQAHKGYHPETYPADAASSKRISWPQEPESTVTPPRRDTTPVVPRSQV
jgi:hypothetical protein